MIAAVRASALLFALAGQEPDEDLLRRAQDARLAGDYATARRIIDEAPGTRTPEELFAAALTSLREAEELDAAGDVEKKNAALADAAQRLDGVLKVAPDFEEARNNRALAYFSLGRREEAFTDLAAAIDGASGDRSLYRRNLGDLYARANLRDEAASLYASILDDYPYDAETLASILELGLERTADGAERMLHLARRSAGPLASAGPLRVLRAEVPGRLQDLALLDLTRDFAGRLPVEPLETFREEVATMPDRWREESAQLSRLMSDEPLDSEYEWWRESEERRAAFVGLLQGRALRALADGHDMLAADLAEKASEWAGPADVAAAVKFVEFALAAHDPDRAMDAVERVRRAHPGRIPNTKDTLRFQRAARAARAKQDDVPTVHFDPAESGLGPNETRMLRNLAARAKRDGGPVHIVGHTDSVHGDASNLDLSDRRAAAVRDFLVGQGVPAGQIVVDARGEKDPVASNLRERGRQKNRRAEIRIGAKSNPASSRPKR